MIVDADPAGNVCHKALFNIGGSTTTSRSWTIRVTQYGCGDTDSSGYEITFYQFHIQSFKKFNWHCIGDLKNAYYYLLKLNKC